MSCADLLISLGLAVIVIAVMVFLDWLFTNLDDSSALPGASSVSAQTTAHPASAPDRSGERPEGRKSDGESPPNGRSGDDIGAADFLPEG